MKIKTAYLYLLGGKISAVTGSSLPELFRLVNINMSHRVWVSIAVHNFVFHM